MTDVLVGILLLFVGMLIGAGIGTRNMADVRKQANRRVRKAERRSRRWMEDNGCFECQQKFKEQQEQ